MRLYPILEMQKKKKKNTMNLYLAAAAEAGMLRNT